MKVGIESLDLYAGRFYLDILDLVKRRDNAPLGLNDQIMVDRRSIYPPYEDAVTLAVNATRRLLTRHDPNDVGLLIVATESAVDFAKPVSTWVQRYCGLPAHCRNFEIKHACYSGVAALRMAASWVASGVEPGRKALVVCSDYSRSHLGSPAEFVAGGCAVAFLVSENPRVLELEMDKTGYWTQEIADVFRPTSRVELGDNDASLFSYLDALDGSFDHFRQKVEEFDFDSFFQKHIYHAPFPGMAFQSHRSLLNRSGQLNREQIEENYQRKVAGGISFAKQVGSAYAASNFLCLLSLLVTSRDLDPGDRVSFFSYGSGCQGEFYSGLIGADAREIAVRARVEQHLGERQRLEVDQYEEMERQREQGIDQKDYRPDRPCTDECYEKTYDGAELLVLEEVRDFRRSYIWS